MRPALFRRLLVVSVLASMPFFGPVAALQRPAAASGFAETVARLSEPDGAFDTDNLISNERAYLHIIPALVSGAVSGGAYIGVGPDQNFSYIARIRPTVAYIVDIRRDNLLLHLLFKALFARSTTRIEYLSLLTGRAPPSDLDRWTGSTIAQIAAYVDRTAPDEDKVAELRQKLDAAMTAFGVPLSRTDLQTIDRFHRTFIAGGLGLQFQSFGRAPQFYYPTFRDLVLATDTAGHPWNYLASEEDFQFVKALEERDGLVPVVGNLAGPHAMRAVAEAIAARGQRVSGFYVSNVENYLYRDGLFGRFIENVERLPRDSHSVIIRSIFGGGGSSTSVIEPIDALLTHAPRSRGR